MEQTNENNLNVLLGEVAPVPTLEEMMGPENKAPSVPLSATRNRAATLSLLSNDPAKTSELYQLLVKEGTEGNQQVAKQLQDNIVNSTQKMDMKGAISILGDKNIPLAQKQAAIEQLKNSQFLSDSSTILHSNALSKASAGETITNETARLSSADAIREVYRARNKVQAIVNGHAAGLPDKSIAGLTTDITALQVMPFGMTSSYGAVGNKLAEVRGEARSKWDRVVSYLTPGSTVMEIRERLANVPPEKREQMAKDIVSAVQSSSGVIFGEDNHFAQMDIMTRIFEEGGYSSTEKFIDNVSPILDAVGVGMVLRDTTKAGKAVLKGKAAGPTAAIPSTPSPTSPTSATTAPAAPVGSPTVTMSTAPIDTNAARLKAINQLQEQRAEMLGQAGNLAEPGAIRQMKEELKVLDKKLQPADKESIATLAKKYQKENKLKYKDALDKATKDTAFANADVEATRKRLQDQIDANRDAANVEKNVQMIDQQIKDLSKGMGETPGAKDPLGDLISRIQMNGVIRTENPSSPAKIIQQSNPEQARNLHEAVVLSPGDEAADGLYGTSKQDAIVSDVFPQIATETNVITDKVNDIERNLRKRLGVPQEIIDAINNSGANFFSSREKKIANAVIHNDFTDVEGLVINDALSTFQTDGGKILISASYGTPEGAFLRAEDALDQAKLALRNQGVLDEEITILEKQGLDYVPVKLNDVLGKEGSYLIRVDTEMEIFANDIGDLDKLDVKRNLFDRMGITVTKSAGSLSRWIMDAASMLHPRITEAASVVSDQTAKFEKMMLDVASEFSDKFVKLDKTHQGMVNSYLREANYQGLKLDPVNLMARGFSNEGISTVISWRKFWDSHFYLENYDVVRSLSSNGYMKFDHPIATLFAKPIAKNQNIITVYDPAIDAVRALTKIEMDDLYLKGGTMARLRRPTAFNGTTVEHMMVRQTPTEYLRKLRDTDQVLNYRNGYFQIQYTAPKFVEQIIKDSRGIEVGRKVHAVAGDTKEATTFMRGLARQQGLPESDFNVRGDTRAMRKDDDAYWDVTSAGGRIAQRHRGKLLEDASGLNHLGDGSYILNPVDSARRAAMSISGRTVTRPMLDAAKERFIQQYAEALPKNSYGEARWPQNVKEIGIPGKETSKAVADARTTFEYIRYLENGYINTIDEAFKAFFHMIADIAGSKGMSRTERGATAVSNVAPTGAAKNAVFMSYIGSNILRQWVLQPHQIIRTWAYNPTGWLSGRIPKLAASYWGELAGFSTSAEGKAFKKFIDDSGLMAAVDKSNLIKGTLLDAANTSNKALRIAKTPLELSRKLGFDLGEQVNLLGHAAAVYERKIREGLDMSDKALRDDAYAQIRAISGEMNFAGDMPYNQNSFSALLQFMQVPQKMMLQMTNRKIPMADSLRILGGDIVFWGPPTLLIGDLLGADVLPENPEIRELVTSGVESWAYNRLFSELSGERVSIDFASLAPYEMTGWKKFAEAMLTGGSLGVITNSPAGQLFLKDGGRVQKAVESIGRYFGAFEEVGQDKTEFLEMLDSIGKISSGWNNFAKAKLLLETRKRLDQYGSVTDDEVTKYEAFAQVLGFGTTDTRDLYKMSQAVATDTKEYKDSVLRSYNDIKRYYYDKFNEEITSERTITAITGWALKAYGDEPIALQIIQSQLKLDLQGKDEALLGLIIKGAQVPTIGNMRDRIKLAPLEEEKKQQLYQMIDELEKTRLENKIDKE